MREERRLSLYLPVVYQKSDKQGYVRCLEFLPSKAGSGSRSDPSQLACPMPRLQLTRAGHNLLQFI